jgi:hypothetical protein
MLQETGTERRISYAEMIALIEAETGVRLSRKTLINDVSAGRVEGIVRIGHRSYGTAEIARSWFKSKIRPHPRSRS